MDPDGGQRRPENVSHQPVRLGRQGQVAHMVVGHIDSGRPQPQRLLRDPAGVDLGHFNAALGHPPHTQHLALAIQAQDIDHLVSGPKEVGLQPGVGVLRPVDHRRQPCPGALIAAQQGREHPQQHCGVLSHPRHLFQLLHRRVQRPGQGAEPLHQLVGQTVHIPLRDGIAQKQFQDLVVRPALQAPGQKFRLQPLPVTGVVVFPGFCHGIYPSPSKTRALPQRPLRAPRGRGSV